MTMVGLLRTGNNVARDEGDGSVTLNGRWTIEELRGALSRKPDHLDGGWHGRPTRHLRTIPHTATRALMRRAKEEGTPYTSVEHFLDKRFALPIQWGLPVDITVRDPRRMLVSAFHHVAMSRLSLYAQIYTWKDRPNVNLIHVERDLIDLDPGESATPDFFGLRKKYFEDGETFPDDVLSYLPKTTRAWLRAEFYPDI